METPSDTAHQQLVAQARAVLEAAGEQPVIGGVLPATPDDSDARILQLEQVNAGLQAQLTEAQTTLAARSKELGEAKLLSARHETIARKFTRKGVSYEGELDEVKGLKLGEDGISIVGDDGQPRSVGDYAPPRLVRSEMTSTPPNQGAIPQQAQQPPEHLQPQPWVGRWRSADGSSETNASGRPIPRHAV